MTNRISRLAYGSAAWMLLSQSSSVLACAVCFGKSDSALTKGLHWGVISLLAVVVCVLGAIASFFIYLAKRSAAMPDLTSANSATPTKNLP